MRFAIILADDSVRCLHVRFRKIRV